MTTKRFLFIGLLLIGVALALYAVFSTGSSSPAATVADPAAYRQRIDAERRKKDEFMRTNAESPVQDKAAFNGLPYFAPDPAYRISARLEPFATPEKFAVPLTDGSEEVYEKYAHAVFELGGAAHRLLIVRQPNGQLSILFKDATSGKETYGGGRYLDLDAKDIAENTVVIDFNAAYSPYCAYNHQYACPLPPKENTLPVAVQAGEKVAVAVGGAQ